MTAKNMAQLNSILMKEIKKAMLVVEKKAIADMYDETGKFYTKAEPKVYERTGALGDTPRTTSPTIKGNSVSFEAYLDTSHQYTTGKNPNMQDVLNLANYGIKNSSVGKLRDTVGEKGFWERSKEKIEKEFIQTMNEFFKKT